MAISNFAPSYGHQLSSMLINTCRLKLGAHVFPEHSVSENPDSLMLV